MTERDEINIRQNKFLFNNWERLNAQKDEIREPINKNGKQTSVIQKAKQLYDSGRTYKQIALLLGVSLTTAGRLIKMNDYGSRKH